MKQVLVKPLLQFWGGLPYDEIYLSWSVLIIDKIFPELEVSIHFAVMYMYREQSFPTKKKEKNLKASVYPIGFFQSSIFMSLRPVRKGEEHIFIK